MPYKTFTEMMETAKDLSGGIGGKLSDEANKALLSFYNYWGNYLDPIPAFLAFMLKPVGILAKGLYLFTSSLEHVFNNLFKLFGLFGYLSDQNTLIGQFYYWFQLLGVVIFTLLVIARAVYSLFGKRMKYKDTVTHFILVTLVVAVLPTAITKISTTMAEDVQRIQTVGGSEGENSDNSYSSLAIQPMKNNVVDLKVLIDNDFDTQKFPMDDFGFIKPVQKNSTPVNNITDSKSDKDSTNFVTRIDFGAMLGTTDVEQLEKLEKQNKGLKGLFLHKKNSMQDGINVITEHRVADGLNAFEDVYPRYKVNWLGMFAQYIVLIILLIMMSIKVVKSIFETVLTAIIAPIQGYTSTESSKKFKELLMTIGGAIAGIFFEIVIMRVTLEVMRDLPTISLSGIASLSGSFFDGLNMWEQCITSIIVYLGIFFGAMQGVTIIERWLGVSTGHSDTAQQIMGGMMMANALGAGAKGAAQGVMGAGSAAVNIAKKTPSTLARAGSTAGKGIAAAGGGLAGAVDSVKEQGFKDTAKAGLTNAAEKANSKVAGAVGGVTNKASAALDESMDTGYNATKGALKDNYPSPDKMPIQTNESLKEDIPGTSDDGNGDRNVGLQYGSREEMGLPNPHSSNDNQVESSSPSESENSTTIPSLSTDGDEKGYGLNSDQLSSPQNLEATSNETGGLSVPEQAVPQNVREANQRLTNDPAYKPSKGLNTQGVNGGKTSQQGISKPQVQKTVGGVNSSTTSPSSQQTSQNRGKQEPQKQYQPSNFQKSTQNFQQMKNIFDQGAQRFNSSRGHIRGAEEDEED